MQIHFLLIHSLFLFTSTSRAECPRKRVENVGDIFDDSKTMVGAGKAPSARPPETRISCTYMHNDKSEKDRNFSDDVRVVLVEITERLQQEIHLILTVEEVNCAEEEPKCLEYSLQESFHWIIIDDPKRGAAVYEINDKLNSRRAIIEASLLDVLSRHSVHDLTMYCSKEGAQEVGFVRQLSTEELIGKRRKPKMTGIKSAISRSPFELNLIELSLLELRVFDKTTTWHQLKRMDGDLLNDALMKDKLTFVIFWNAEYIISQYAFYLWAETSNFVVSQFPEALFGALACHELGDVCKEYISTTSDQHTIFAFKKNSIFARTENLRDSKYYLDWVHRLMVPSTQQIKSDDELKQIKIGKLKSFDEIRPAITVGIFNDPNCNEAKIFKEVAEDLKGKYHFVYYIKERHPNTVYTIRVQEHRKRLDFTDVFEIRELSNFVVRSSLPSVIDISDGFTSDVLMHHSVPVMLLLSGNNRERSSFSDLCSKSSSVICTTMSIEKSEPVIKVLQALQTDNKPEKIFTFIKEKIYAVDAKIILESENFHQIIALAIAKGPIKVLGMDDIHPLRHLQVAQINKIFGDQSFNIPSEVQIIRSTYQDKIVEMNGDGDDFGGCPVMARFRHTMTKNEL